MHLSIVINWSANLAGDLFEESCAHLSDSKFRKKTLPFFCSEFLSILLKTGDRKSTRLNSSHVRISYAVFCLKKKKKQTHVPLLGLSRPDCRHGCCSVQVAGILLGRGTVAIRPLSLVAVSLTVIFVVCGSLAH